MKPSIDEQIEAVQDAMNYISGVKSVYAGMKAPLEAALSTLRWVKLKTKPALGQVMEAFPGAKVVSQDGEERMDEVEELDWQNAPVEYVDKAHRHLSYLRGSVMDYDYLVRLVAALMAAERGDQRE